MAITPFGIGAYALTLWRNSCKQANQAQQTSLFAEVQVARSQESNSGKLMLKRLNYAGIITIFQQSVIVWISSCLGWLYRIFVFPNFIGSSFLYLIIHGSMRMSSKMGSALFWCHICAWIHLPRYLELRPPYWILQEEGAIFRKRWAFTPIWYGVKVPILVV